MSVDSVVARLAPCEVYPSRHMGDGEDTGLVEERERYLLQK